jgi:hypothetical protein
VLGAAYGYATTQLLAELESSVWTTQGDAIAIAIAIAHRAHSAIIHILNMIIEHNGQRGPGAGELVIGSPPGGRDYRTASDKNIFHGDASALPPRSLRDRCSILRRSAATEIQPVRCAD